MDIPENVILEDVGFNGVPTQLRYRLYDSNQEILIIEIIGYLEFPAGHPYLDVLTVVPERFQRIVFDCSRMQYSGESGPGLFFNMTIISRENHGALILVSVPPEIKEVWDLLGYSQFLINSQSVDEALELLSTEPLIQPQFFGDQEIDEEITQPRTSSLEDRAFWLSDTYNPEAPGKDMARDEIRELCNVLQIMNMTLEGLSDEEIQGFARSEHFEVYKSLFAGLGIEDGPVEAALELSIPESIRMPDSIIKQTWDVFSFMLNAFDLLPRKARKRFKSSEKGRNCLNYMKRWGIWDR